MQERRSKRRFRLGLFGMVYHPTEAAAPPARQVKTANVSTGGAYLLTLDPLPPGTPVHLEVFVPVAEGVQGTLAGSCIRLSAEVIRSEPGGMALRFHGAYEIMSVSKLLARSQADRQGRAPVGRPPSGRASRNALSALAAPETTTHGAAIPIAAMGGGRE